MQTKNTLFALLVVAAFAIAPIAGVNAQTLEFADGQADVDARVGFAFNPTPNELGSWHNFPTGYKGQASGPFDQSPYLDPYFGELYYTFHNGTLAAGNNLGSAHAANENASALAKVYGSNDRAQHTPDLYASGMDPFNPDIIPTDSVTFNAAVIIHTASDYATVNESGYQESLSDTFDWIRACSQDANLKKHLRIWYEPNHDFHGPRVDSGNYDPATVADVIQVESTYYLIDAASWRPSLACPGNSDFPFPTEGLNYTGSGSGSPQDVFWSGNRYNTAVHNQPGLDTLRPAHLAMVSGSGTNGLIRLETRWTAETGSVLQWFDHMIEIESIFIDAVTGNIQVEADMSYIGNTYPDAVADVAIGSLTFWDRANNGFPDPLHNGANGETRTFYTELVGVPRSSTGEDVIITVGKEFQQGDVFYTDGVRYELPSIHVVDGNLASITLRTPLPKSDPFNGTTAGGSTVATAPSPGENGNWTSVTTDPDNRVALIGQGHVSYQDEDFSVVTTQWVVEYNVTDPLPVDPPYNHQNYTMVDDIDVQLWECGTENTNLAADATLIARCKYFPWGLTVEETGLPKYTHGASYLTQQDPPADWVDYFKAQKTDYWDIRDRLAFKESGINHHGNPAELKPQERIKKMQIAGVYVDFPGNGLWGHTAAAWVNHTATNFSYSKEWYEGRVTTNLLQIPSFESPRDWGKYETNVDPDKFTMFLLPNRTNPASELNTTFHRWVGPLSNYTLSAQFGGQPAAAAGFSAVQNAGMFNWTWALGGDYLHTTSHYLQDGATRWAFAIVTDDFWGYQSWDPDRAAVSARNRITPLDPYVNPEFQYEFPNVDFTSNHNYTVNVYGSTDRADHAPDLFGAGSDAFNPAVIPKDSVTFNAAVIIHTASDYATVNESGYQESLSDTFDWIRACSQDANLKKHLRIWYEPNHDFHGPRVDSGNYDPATVADVIQVESTYYLIDAASWRPSLACPGNSDFPFPTEGLNYTGSGSGVPQDVFWSGSRYNTAVHNQPGLDTLRPAHLAMVSGSGTNGLIRLETRWTAETGSILQWFDHMIEIESIFIDAVTGNIQVEADMSYIGNTYPDAVADVAIGSLTFWDRANNGFPDPLHNGANGETRTFYTELVGVPRSSTGEDVIITVGKEFQQGDVFYTDGVRYELPSIHVVDGNLASITLRTPLPKSDPFNGTFWNTGGGTTIGNAPGDNGNWTSVTTDPDNRVALIGQGHVSYQDEDFSVVTTQWVVEYNVTDPLPVDPPYTHHNYTMVDDTDVLLWECGTENTNLAADATLIARCKHFPYGLTQDETGLPKYSHGEAYLTNMDPPADWVDYFKAQKTDYWDIRDRVAPRESGINHWGDPGNMDPQERVRQVSVAAGGWIKDPKQLWPTPAVSAVHNGWRVNFSYQLEWFDDRFSTNFLEKPIFESPRDWEFIEVNSHPDWFTRFTLPNRTNPASYLNTSFEDSIGPLMGFRYNHSLLGGDYYVLTSYRQDGGAAPQPPPTTSSTTTTSTTTTTAAPTSTTTTSGSTQTPGFELIALVAALGAAFVLVRRRL